MEKLELISERIKGRGDTWKLVGEETEYSSLTNVLEAYFNKTKQRIEYRLDPMGGKIYAILEDDTPPPIQSFNIYGDPI